MKKSAKLPFALFSLLVVGIVSWYLQHPPGITPQADTTRCTPAGIADPTGFAECAAAASLGHLLGNNITQVRLFHFDGIRTQWLLQAPSAQNNGEERIVVHQPNLTIYQKDGQIVSVTSDEGSVDNQTHNVVFTGDVVAVQRARRLETSMLRFDPGERILYTDCAFSLEEEDMRLEGVGLTLYQETKKLVVSQQVKLQMAGSGTALPKKRVATTPWGKKSTRWNAGEINMGRTTVYHRLQGEVLVMTPVSCTVLPC